MSKYIIPFLCWLAAVILASVAWFAIWGVGHSFLSYFTAGLAGLLGWNAGSAIWRRRQSEE